jgi:peptide chain release factor 1
VLDLAKLRDIVAQFDELTERLCDPDLLGDPTRYRAAAQQRSGMESMVGEMKRYLSAWEQHDQVRAELEKTNDPEIQAMFKEEFAELKEQIEQLEPTIRKLMLPKDPYAGKNVIIEIRPAAGGDEAAIFAGDLFRMYSKFAERCGWTSNVLESQATELGGFKEVVFEIQGFEVYGRMKYESGVHRVQRVPATEAQGRIHTSTVTVAVMPEAETVDEVPIDTKDLKIDTYRSQGAGGQHVNKTESAIRITHLPTGVVVACQEERSQIQNRERAMRVLRAKLLDMERTRIENEITATRKSQVGTGDRSEKIRTYNYPQSRVTDHRIGLSIMNLAQIMEGDLDEIVQALQAHEQEALLQEAGA